MKRIMFTLMAAMTIALNAAAQTDTIVVKNADEVKVVTTGDTLSVSIRGKKDEPNYYFNKTVAVDSDKADETISSSNVGSRIGWDFSLIEDHNSSAEIELRFQAQLQGGFNFLLGKPSDMKLKQSKSSNLGIDVFEIAFCPAKKKWWMGLNWGAVYNRIQLDNCMMTTSQDVNVGIAQYPEGSDSRSSFFNTIASNLTLMGHYNIAKHRSLGLGVSWSSTVFENSYYKTKYNLSDGTKVVDMNELPLRTNLFSIKAEYMMDYMFGFYLRYTPMSMFHKGKGPDFQQLCFGGQIRF